MADQKRLLHFAEQHCGLQRKRADMILEEVKQGVRQAQKELGHDVSHLEGFSALGRAMMKEWEKGLGDV